MPEQRLKIDEDCHMKFLRCSTTFLVTAMNQEVPTAPTNSAYSLVLLALIPSGPTADSNINLLLFDKKKSGAIMFKLGLLRRECIGRRGFKETRYGDDAVIPAVDAADGVRDNVSDSETLSLHLLFQVVKSSNLKPKTNYPQSSKPAAYNQMDLAGVRCGKLLKTSAGFVLVKVNRAKNACGEPRTNVESQQSTVKDDTWKTADTVPAGSGVPATSIPAGSINQAAGGSAVPSTPSSSVVEPVHADTPTSSCSHRHLEKVQCLERVPLAAYESRSTKDHSTDYLHCPVACFLISTLNQAELHIALNDPYWVEAKRWLDEADQIILAIATTWGFKVYQMDVKSASSMGNLMKIPYVTQLKSAKGVSLTFFLGLQDKQQPDGFLSAKTVFQDMRRRFDME
ncbi:hypothetical protein Tco_0085407 [Tanacetum coccineum]